MHQLSLRQYERANGHRLWTLVDDKGMPDFDVTNFLTSKYLQGAKPNTLKNIAIALRQCRTFENQENISIRVRLREARILNLQETLQLIGFCGRRIKRIFKKLNVDKVVPIKKNENKVPVEFNATSTQGQRAYYVGEYINFLIDDEVSGPYMSTLERDLLRKEQINFKAIYYKYIPNKEAEKFDPERALKQEEASAILDITQGKQEELACLLFKHEISRTRNLLIIEILLFTGIRVSELAGLLIKDVLEEESVLLIRENKKEKNNDKRTVRPGFKTRERPIMIDSDLMKRLSKYLSARKGGRPTKAKHEYVFCAEGPEARAISLSALYTIVAKLKVIFGSDWKRKLSPHILRHTFFDVWFRHANKIYNFKNNPELFEQVVTAARMTGGWCPDSEMINYYKQRFVFEQASEVTLGTQRRMVRGKE